MSEQERNLDGVTTSMDVAALNNLVVSKRPLVQQVKVQVTGKLSKQIRLCKKRHGSEEQKAVYMKKAERMAQEIAALKKANLDQLAKYCFANTLTFDEAAKTNDAEKRVFTRVATHKLMSDKVNAWRAEHDDWKALAAFMLSKNTGRRIKKKPKQDGAQDSEDEDEESERKPATVHKKPKQDRVQDELHSEEEDEESERKSVTVHKKPKQDKTQDKQNKDKDNERKSVENVQKTSKEKVGEKSDSQNMSAVKNILFAKRTLEEEGEKTDSDSNGETQSVDVRRTVKKEEEIMEASDSQNESGVEEEESENSDQSEDSECADSDNDACEDKTENEHPKKLKTAGSNVSHNVESCVMELNLSSFAGKALAPIKKSLLSADSEGLEDKKKKKDSFFAKESGDEDSEEEEEEEEKQQQLEEEKDEDHTQNRFSSHQDGSRYKSGKFEKWDKKGGKKFDGPRGKKFNGPGGKFGDGANNRGLMGKKYGGGDKKYGGGDKKYGGGDKKYGGLGGGSKAKEPVAAAPAIPEKLHPSWEASRKRKQQQSIVPTFTGKKIKFDD